MKTEMQDRDRDGIYETAVPDDKTRTPPHGDALRPNPIPRRLPPSIERAARKTYAAGHRAGIECEFDGNYDCDDQRGVDAFRESLEHDADEARGAS